MDAWLSSVNLGDEFATCNDNADWPGEVLVVPSGDGKKLFIVSLEDYTVVTDPTNPLENFTNYMTYIGYNSEDIIYEGQEVPAGWHILKVNLIETSEGISYEYEAIPITTKSEFYFKFYGYLNGYSETITSVDSGFDAINGKVIGIVEGEPAQYFNYSVTVNNGNADVYTVGAKDGKIEKYGQITVEQIEPDEGYTAPAVNSTVVTNCTIFNEYPPLGPTIQDVSVCSITGDATITLTCIEETNP
jgi:hypothetical protein